MSNVGKCLKCKNMTMVRQGLAVCSLDTVDIIIHANEAGCPLGYFAKGLPKEAAKPSQLSLDLAEGETLLAAGDAIAVIAEGMGLDRMAKVYEALTGKSCGCEDRQASLNRKYPSAGKVLTWLAKRLGRT